MIRMKMFELKCILLLILTTTFVGVQMLQIEEDTQEAHLALASKVLNKTGITLETIDMITNEEDSEDAKIDLIQTEIEDLSGKLDNIESDLSNLINDLRRILTKTLRQSHALDDRMRDLSRLIISVNQIYKKHLLYSNATGNSQPPDRSILEFATSIILPGPGHLQDKLQQISLLISPIELTDDSLKDFFTRLAEDTASSAHEACGASLSAQQQLYRIYLMLMLSEREGLDVIDYAYTQVTRLTNSSHDWDLKIANKNTNERLKTYYHYLSKAMQKASRDIRPCDPKKHERNVTFIEFEKLFGLYVVNQADDITLHRLACRNGCEENAWHIKFDPENLRTTVVTSALSSKSGWDYSFEDYCYGTLTNCWTIEDAEYCQIPGSVRRFEWIKDINGFTYGNDKAGCPNGLHYYRQRWFHWDALASCDYCMCQCNLLPGAPSGIILISLMEQVADVDHNKVVTGVRFALNGGIVSLQIKEGELLKRGRILNSQWKPIMNITNQRNLIIKQLQDDGSYTQLKRGEHYEALSTKAKTIFLDDIVVPSQYVVTGVRIKAEDGFPEGEKAFHLEVLATPFEYLTGKLNTSDGNKSHWISYKLMEIMKSPAYLQQRSKLMLESPDNPLKNEVNTFDSKPNQFVQLKYSDTKLDAGQMVVPLVDIQPVEATPDTLLSGVGILHKGATGFGGFIAPQIFTYDFSAHLKPKAFRAQPLKP